MGYRLVAGVGILFGGGVVSYLVRPIISQFVTGTSFSDNVMTYLVPFAIFVATIGSIFAVIFRRKRVQ